MFPLKLPAHTYWIRPREQRRERVRLVGEGKGGKAGEEEKRSAAQGGPGNASWQGLFVGVCSR